MDNRPFRILLDSDAPMAQRDGVGTEPPADSIYEHRVKIAAVY
jgi:hypothetical protein